MANYMATTRTNYFRVKDEEKFIDIMEKVTSEDELEIFTRLSSDGTEYFGFGCYGTIYGFKNPDDDDDFYEDDLDSFLKALQEVVAEDDAIVIMEVGSEKLRYVIGSVLVITSSDIQQSNLDEIALALGRKMLGNEHWKTTTEY